MRQKILYAALVITVALGATFFSLRGHLGSQQIPATHESVFSDTASEVIRETKPAKPKQEPSSSAPALPIITESESATTSAFSTSSPYSYRISTVPDCRQVDHPYSCKTVQFFYKDTLLREFVDILPIRQSLKGWPSRWLDERTLVVADGFGDGGIRSYSEYVYDIESDTLTLSYNVERECCGMHIGEMLWLMTQETHHMAWLQPNKDRMTLSIAIPPTTNGAGAERSAEIVGNQCRTETKDSNVYENYNLCLIRQYRAIKTFDVGPWDPSTDVDGDLGMEIEMSSTTQARVNVTDRNNDVVFSLLLNLTTNEILDSNK